MKVGRNDPCPCGSGKKYKRCCMDSIAKQRAEVFDDIAQTVAMSPNLSSDELNTLANHKIAGLNDRPVKDFCDLTPTQMYNWLYAPFDELTGVTIKVPKDLSSSPVMRYVALIIDEAISQGGSMKATTKGNLPVKVVKKASALLPEFAISKFETEPSISEFTGSNEDKFNALHYARLLAELSGIIELKNNHFYINSDIQKQYHERGISTFFLLLLEVAVKQYNWSYLDGWPEDLNLQPFWLFMLWRLQIHGSMDKLIKEVCIAFPDLLQQIPSRKYSSSRDQMGSVIEVRFVQRFLQFWGFVTLDPKEYVDNVKMSRQVEIQSLLKNNITFSV